MQGGGGCRKGGEQVSRGKGEEDRRVKEVGVRVKGDRRVQGRIWYAYG